MSQRRSTGAAPVGRPPKAARRRVDPARKLLGGAVVMVVLGSFLPWVSTAVGNVSGARGAGLWTFYASMLGLAGALLPSRRWAGIQAAVFAAAAVALPTWQLVHLLTQVGVAGWLPGPGLVLVLGGGVVAGVAAARLLRTGDQLAAHRD